MAPETYRRGGDRGWSAGRMTLLVILTHDDEEEAGAESGGGMDRWLVLLVHLNGESELTDG